MTQHELSQQAADAAAAHLNGLLQRSKLLVAVGSGGVGKTTTAAALAIAAARSGRRAAVLTIDPARRLAQALGLERMGNTPRALPADLTSPGSVDAMMLEAPEALDDLVARLVPDPARRARLFENRLYQVIARHLGGTHEYMAVERLFGLMESSAYDVVILDTPPTVNALDFLDAPTRLSSFFSDRITRFFIRQADEKRGLIQRLRDRAGDIAIQILGKALGEGFVEELMDFATAFQGLFGAFRERGVVAEKILRDAGTTFVVITGADPVRVNEAAEFTRTLQKLELAPKAFIANRVHVDAGADSAGAVEAGDVATALEGRPGAEPVLEGLQRAQRVRMALLRRDRAGLARMAALCGAERLVIVPELDDEVQDRGAIEHLVDVLQPGSSRARSS